MTTDTVLYALTTVQRKLVTADYYDADQREEFCLSTDCLRDSLRAGDVTDFDNTIAQGMRHYPDRYDTILGELFAVLGIDNRDQLSAILAAA